MRTKEMMMMRMVELTENESMNISEEYWGGGG